MSNKAKAATYLGTAFRPKPRLRLKLPSSTHGRGSVDLNSGIRSTYDPNQPGCSKWFSTTINQFTISQRTFFSSNSSSSPSAQAQTQTRSEPQIQSSRFKDITHEDKEMVEIPLPYTSKTPHLPLPPTLPYSPNSYPFKRHLEILSLSFYSTPDESWSVYMGLHPSLRPYIPDETFKSLLLHQVDHVEQARGWTRTKMLLKLAKKCRMPLDILGSEGLNKILRLGMRRFRIENDSAQKEKEKSDEIFRLIRKLWMTLEAMIGMRNISHELKRGWLGVQRRRINSILQTSRGDANDQITSIEDSVLEMVKKGGTIGLGFYIGDIFSNSSTRSTQGLKRSLASMIICMTQGVDIKTIHVVKVMRKLNHLFAQEGINGLEMIREVIASILKELKFDTNSNNVRTLYQALDIVSERSRTRVQKALDLLETNNLSIGEMIGRGISVSLSAKEDSITRLNAALRLLEAALQHREDGDCNALITSLTIALYNARRTSPVDFEIDQIDQLIVRFVRLLHEAQIPSRLHSESIIPLFRLVSLALPSTEAYIISRKIYQYARSASPPFKWSHKNISSWRTLFKFSLTPPNLHLHFASRLYTDLMADGIPIRRPDALMLIRAIGTKASPSRAVLLERHIKDYLWSSYGSTSPLILSLVQGLSQGGIKDSELALGLAERLSEGQSLSSGVIETIITQLSKSSKKEDRFKIFHLLEQVSMDKNDNPIKNFNTVLSHLVTSSRTSPDPEQGQLSHSETLGYAILLYREMIKKGITPNSRTISIMLRSLLDSGYLDSASSIFNASMKAKIPIKSFAVGRLMVNLAMSDRTGDAYQVEETWRKLTTRGNEKSWDKGVIGARILVDVKAGNEVDMEEIMKKTGWKGKDSFLRFLHRLKPPRNGSASETQTQMDEAGEDLDQLTEDGFEPKQGGVVSKSSYWDQKKDHFSRRERGDGIDFCMPSNLGMVYH
ncbi:uncharacterized protein IL334_004831 [Kwoniella shivajii]|uniref:Uncharacterized protein n=1 Tax=Kwoniella shivajii TaxID=564305 RepID=A0ABZ1D5E7_9TREE|nr:hypothetical protein IL334_004831 [Kwoniella shivajii]